MERRLPNDPRNGGQAPQQAETSRPVLRGLTGGCAVGYHRAGFDVVGVDHVKQPRYPFPFLVRDALETLEWLIAGNAIRQGPRGRQLFLADFAAIHASPPCQSYSALKSVCRGKEYPDLLPQTRELLIESGLPYVIENVPGAPMRGIFLCGAMFGLRSYRHRIFESSCFLWQPPHSKHKVRVNRRKVNRKAHWEQGGYVTVVGDIGSYVGPEAMGISWMTGSELSQAIPPAYTTFIGKQLMQRLESTP